MKRPGRLVAAITVALLVALLSETPLLAAESAVRSMATILLNFRHVPTVAQTTTLQGILDDPATTAAERVLANALLNVEHIARPEDKPRLEALMRDKSAPLAVKTLAAILENFTHVPTAADKRKLLQVCKK